MLDSANHVSKPYFTGEGVSARTEPSAINSASYVLEQARELANRIDELVNRLCGSVPQAVGQSIDQPKAGSILHGLRQDADRTAELIRNAQGQLNRLEREVM